MSGNVVLAFDAQLAYVELVLRGLGLLSQPVGSPADEVGSEHDEALLEVDCRLGTDFNVVQVEDLFAFLDAGVDRLAGVILLKPRWQVAGDRVGAKVEQSAVLAGFAGVEALQGDIERIRTALQRPARPSDQLRIGAYSHSG